MIRSSQQLHLGMSDEPHPALTPRVEYGLLLILSLIILTAAPLRGEIRETGCSAYYRIAFPSPNDSYDGTTQSLLRGVAPTGPLFECLVPSWLADSIDHTIEQVVENNRSLDYSVAPLDLTYWSTSLWLFRVFSFDPSRETLLLDFRESNGKQRPVYVAADYEALRWYPLIGPSLSELVGQFSRLTSEAPQSMPERPLCLAMIFLSVLYGDCRISLVSSDSDVVQALRLNYFSIGCNPGPLNEYDFYLSDLQQFSVHESLKKEFERFPRDLYGVRRVLSKLQIGGPKLTIGTQSDTVDFWIHVFDTGEVAPWRFVFDKSHRLLELNYLAPPVFVESILGPSLSVYEMLTRK